MNNFIKQVIEEKFASKKQQRLFYAKSSDKSISPKERKKWKKWAQEFSADTDFEKLPEKKKEEVDEIVDDFGNISRNKKPKNFNTKGITSNSMSDEVVKSGSGSMGTHGVHGTHTSLRYWAEADMSKTLGYKETLGKDKDYEDAEEHFEDELNLDEPEAEERLSKMGYDKNLPKDKVRLIENPKKFMSDYIESIIYKKTLENDLVQKETDETEETKEIPSIVQKQLKSLKNTMNTYNLTINDVTKELKK
jgi:hypothetical protein